MAAFAILRQNCARPIRSRRTRSTPTPNSKKKKPPGVPPNSSSFKLSRRRASSPYPIPVSMTSRPSTMPPSSTSSQSGTPPSSGVKPDPVSPQPLKRQYEPGKMATSPKLRRMEPFIRPAPLTSEDLKALGADQPRRATAMNPGDWMSELRCAHYFADVFRSSLLEMTAIVDDHGAVSGQENHHITPYASRRSLPTNQRYLSADEMAWIEKWRIQVYLDHAIQKTKR